MMFSYYGSKSKIVDLYPSPKYDKIIEPFAGSARYSLKWFDRDVLLVDKYQVIVDVWHYLQQASEKDILGLPKPKIGEKISDYRYLSKEESYLMGFLSETAQAQPRNSVTSFSQFYNSKRDIRVQIANQLYKIKHWVIKCDDYKNIKNQVATWFIDPPYQFGGEFQYKYSNKNINYKNLSEWCKFRLGQVIVCENTKADWLPFYPMKKHQGAANTNTTEAIWSNLPHDYMARQPELF